MITLLVVYSDSIGQSSQHERWARLERVVSAMGWFYRYRSWYMLDQPCDVDCGGEALQLDWRVRLAIALASLVITGLLIAVMVSVAG